MLAPLKSEGGQKGWHVKTAWLFFLLEELVGFPVLLAFSLEGDPTELALLGCSV